MSDSASNISAGSLESRGGKELDGLILELIGDAPPLADDERRIRERYPMCCKMLLTPISHDDKQLTSDTLTIFGKDLSLSGICFSHEFPILNRRVAVSLSHPQFGVFHVEAEVVWTRLTLVGLYESGCRLIRKIAGHKISLK
jgi:hypothetical protein